MSGREEGETRPVRERFPRSMLARAWSGILGALRRNLTYANVAATVAVLFSMSGAALAAHHYLINSTSQISPKVLKALRSKHDSGATGAQGATGAGGPEGPAGRQGSAGPQGVAGATGVQGPTGPAGPFGATGPQGSTGATGSEGPPGQVQKPASFTATLEPTEHGEETTELFHLPEAEISGFLVCGPGPAPGTVNAYIRLEGPLNARTQSGILGINSNDDPVEETEKVVQAVLLNPTTPTTVAELASNPATPKTNTGQLDASVESASEDAYIAAFLEAAPYGSKPVCTAEGSAFSVPLS